MANERNEMYSRDCISRQAAIDAHYEYCNKHPDAEFQVWSLKILEYLPAAQPTLYGYEIEHLAYIARVMQKEGVTAEYAVRTFDDMTRMSRMIIEELQEKIEKSLSAMQLPSAELEIIQCKDCRYTDEYGVCQSSKGLAIQDDNDFCSYAERREE